MQSSKNNIFRWGYFWLLMAAGFGLFVSEEAMNVWVSLITLEYCFNLEVTKKQFALATRYRL